MSRTTSPVHPVRGPRPPAPPAGRAHPSGTRRPCTWSSSRCSATPSASSPASACPRASTTGSRPRWPLAVAATCAAGAVRGAAHGHGPSVVQALVDAHGARAGRAGDVRAGREPGAGPAVLGVAAGRRGGLDAVRPGRRRAPRALRGRVGGGPQLDLHDQPRRPVRAAAGLAAPARDRLHPAALHRSAACTGGSVTR